MSADAIFKLYPTVTNINGDTAYDADGNEVAIDMAVVGAWVDPNQYKTNRRAEYPSIGDQLDMIFHAGLGGDEFQAAIQAVKDANPKPE